MRPIDKLFPEKAILKQEGRCPICGKQIGTFRDELSQKEFEISGCCQKCQDLIFGV